MFTCILHWTTFCLHLYHNVILPIKCNLNALKSSSGFYHIQRYLSLWTDEVLVSEYGAIVSQNHSVSASVKVMICILFFSFQSWGPQKESF